jgi:hypothetical protein
MLFAACTTQRDMVQEGRFQRRTHQRGWHIDLHGARDNAPGTRAHLGHLKPRHATAPPAFEDPHERLMACKEPIAIALPRSTRSWEPDIVQAAVPVIAQPPASVEQDGDENVMPKKTWNKLAIPTLVLAVSIIALALLTTSTTAVILAAVTTLVVGGISLRQIRRRAEAGKGFALVGLILGLIATLITAMAITVVGLV